jgi:hypothetical protein
MRYNNPFAREASPALRRSSSTRPRLEVLEDRDVPSFMAAEFPGYGVWRCQDGGAWQQLTAANASQVAADSAGDVVGQFPGQGVWLYSSSTGVWTQITSNDAASLAMGYSSEPTLHSGTFIHVYVAAQFPDQGLWLYNDFTVIAPPAQGGGTSQSASWQLLTPSNASTEGVDTNGHVVAEFPGYGVWLYGAGINGWQQLTPSDATSVAIGSTLFDHSRVAATFPGYGVWRFVDTQGWQQLTASDAATVSIGPHGDVAAAFAGYGVWSYLDSSAAAAAGWGGGWIHLTGANASGVGIDANGNVYGLFNGGIWFDQVGSWKFLPAAPATSIGVGG